MPDPTAGSKLKALDFPPTAYAQETSTFTVTDVTFTTGGHPIVSLTFTANTFGKILLTVGGCGRGESAGTRVEVAAQIFLGSDATGTEVLAATALGRGVIFPEDTEFSCMSRTTRLTGLTPGATYFARIQHRKLGGTTGDLTTRELCVAPLT
jgi:hypothetical protein